MTLAVDIRVERGTLRLAAALSGEGVTALTGPSGAGKSTLIAAIAGLVEPTSGMIRLGGEALYDAKRGVSLPPEARRLGVVFQSAALFPHLSVRDNVAYGAPERVKRHALADEALRRMRADHLADRAPTTLSGGEAARVALARAFARRPRALLLDEPFAALDPELRETIALEVVAWAKELDVPVLLVAHHEDDLRAASSRWVMRQGVVVHQPR